MGRLNYGPYIFDSKVKSKDASKTETAFVISDKS